MPTRIRSDESIYNLCQRYTELTESVRGRNKSEDRLLKVRLRFYEREKNIQLNILRKARYELLRARTSLYEDVRKIQTREYYLRSSSSSSLSSWLSTRPKSDLLSNRLFNPDMFITGWSVEYH